MNNTTVTAKKSTFGFSKWQREGKWVYLGWARYGMKTISTLPFATYTEARQALGAKAEKRGWTLHYFDGEIEFHSVECGSRPFAACTCR
jgi:hypothetical protein